MDIMLTQFNWNLHCLLQLSLATKFANSKEQLSFSGGEAVLATSNQAGAEVYQGRVELKLSCLNKWAKGPFKYFIIQFCFPHVIKYKIFASSHLIASYLNIYRTEVSKQAGLIYAKLRTDQARTSQVRTAIPLHCKYTL